jgi:hypothetical protein
MRPVEFDEIVPLDRYAGVRGAYRDAVIAHKGQRRLSVGDNVTLLFEDRETLRFQIQEMLWIERIADERRVRNEVDVYNELVPGDNELSATLFIEITELPDIRAELDKLIGIDEHVSLLLGAPGEELAIAAHFDRKQAEEDRISAVQYIRFPLGEAGAERFADPNTAARLRIDHPNYRHEVTIPEGVRRSLCETLAGDLGSLMPFAAGSTGPGSEPELLFETARFRALRLPGSGSGLRVVVESLGPASFLTADTELLAEALALVKRVASSVLRDQSACRVWTEVHRDGAPMRWIVQSTET